MPNNYVFNSSQDPLITSSHLYDNNGFPISFTQTAFKDLRVANPYAEAGWTFVYDVNTDLVNVTTSGSGTVTQANSKGVLQTGAATSSSALVQSRRFARYIPGTGLLMEATAIFTTGVAGSTQLLGIGDSTNGFFFGYNGASFGVMRRQNGTDNWIPQNSWNVDHLNGKGSSGMTLDTTKGNIYYINFQWLGFGLITFGVVNPSTGYVIVVHQIMYANANTNPSIFTPNLPMMAQVINTTNNTNITLQSASAMIYLEGIATIANTTSNGINNNSAGVSGNTDTNILTIQNKTTISGISNHVPVTLLSISLSTNGGQNVSVRLVRNATLTGSTTFTDINSTNSCIAYNTTGTYTANSGKFVAGFQLQKVDGQTYDLVNYQYTLQPGETITVAALSGGGTTMTVTMNWREYY